MGQIPNGCITEHPSMSSEGGWKNSENPRLGTQWLLLLQWIVKLSSYIYPFPHIEGGLGLPYPDRKVHRGNPCLGTESLGLPIAVHSFLC